jgi:virginiamycin B lyase
MTDDRNFDRIARAWLELGPNEAPDRAVSAVLQVVATTPQVRRWSQRLSWRYPTMNRLYLAGSLALAAAVVIGGVLVLCPKNQSNVSGPSPTESASSSPASSALPNPQPVTPEASITVTKPSYLASDGQVLWVLTLDGALVRIDPATNRADPAVQLDGPPYATNGVSANAAAVWSTRFSPGLVYRVDPATQQVVARIETTDPIDVLAALDAVWVSNIHTGTVTRIDPATNKIVATIPVGTTGSNGPHALGSGFGSIWAVDRRDFSVTRIDPSTNAVQASIDIRSLVPSGVCGGLFATGDAMWTFCDSSASGIAAEPREPLSALRIDPSTNKAVGMVDLHGHGLFATVVDGNAWVSVDRGGADSGLIVRINPTTNQVDRVLSPGANFGGGGNMVLAAGSVWVMDGANNQLLRLPLSAFGS